MFNFIKQGIMKRVFRLVTVLAVALLLLPASGLFAQVPNANYTQYLVSDPAPANVDYVTIKAGGTVMGYYALPDPVYHPNYNAGDGWALTAGFTWAWTNPTNPGSAATFNKPGAANYVEITYPVVGDYVINVAETAPPAFGGCADATPTVLDVTVIAAPTAVITTADPAQACGDQLAMAVAMTFTEAVPASLASYAFSVSEVVENIDATGTPTATVSTNNTFVDYPTGGKLKAPALTGAGPFGFSFNTSALTIQHGLRTRYTYTLHKASNAPVADADGVISAISEKSDYVSGTVNTYAFGAKTTLVAIVNPAPNTGPIYHIPNTYAY